MTSQFTENTKITLPPWKGPSGLRQWFCEVTFALKLCGMRYDSDERPWLLDVRKSGMEIGRLAKFWPLETLLGNQTLPTIKC